jgi:hypothetical protein
LPTLRVFFLRFFITRYEVNESQRGKEASYSFGLPRMPSASNLLSFFYLLEIE